MRKKAFLKCLRSEECKVEINTERYLGFLLICVCAATKTERVMTQEEKWQAKYEEVVAFIETNHRNPSKHRIEEHDMLNWLKANRKKMNAGTLKPERVVPFKQLLELIEKNKRLNQYQ